MNHGLVCPIVSDPCGSQNRSATLQKAVCAGLGAEEECEEGLSSARLMSGQVPVYMEGLDSSMLPAAAAQGSQDSRTSKPSMDEGYGTKKGPELYESTRPIRRTSEQWPPGKA